MPCSQTVGQHFVPAILLIAILAAGCAGTAATAPAVTAPGTSPTGAAAGTLAPQSSVPPSLPATGLRGLLGQYPPLPTAKVPATVATRLQAALDDALRLHGGMTDASPGGITAAVIGPACGIWTGATGERAAGAPMTADTQLLLASVTKTLTAAAVLRLVEEGRVDLDAPIAKYLPPTLAVDTNGATVRQVLRMRSGLSDIKPDVLAAEAMAKPNEPMDRAAVLATLGAPSGAPDTATEYVDSNYMLLSYVIEGASGMTVANAFRSLILGHPGLARLVFEDAERPQGPLALGNVDTSYRTTTGLQAWLGQALGTGFVPSRSFASIDSTAGAAVADAPTLARWGYLLYGGSVVSRESLAEMTDIATGDVPYGMGTHDLRWPFGMTGIGHTGWDMGYLAALLTRAESGVTVAAFVNDERLQGFWELPDQLADIVAGC